MRSLAFVCVPIGLHLAACGAGHYSPDRPEEAEPADPTLDWPKDAPGLLSHLNGWDKSSLEAHERPDLDMSKHLVAETDGTGEWVDLHTKKLQALGVTIRWNRETRIYERQP